MRERGMKWTVGILITASMVAASLAAMPAAGASSAVTSIRTAMTLVPVIRVLGPTAGRSERVNILLASGETISIPAADESLVNRRMAEGAKGSTSPDATISGSCGSSNVYIYDKSNGHPIRMTTGFTVKHEAVSYSWEVIELGLSSGYDYTYTAGGGLDFDSSWSGGHTSTENPAHGTYYAHVVADDSYALLDTGDICTSGGPSAQKSL